MHPARQTRSGGGDLRRFLLTIFTVFDRISLLTHLTAKPLWICGCCLFPDKVLRKERVQI